MVVSSSKDLGDEADEDDVGAVGFSLAPKKKY